MYSNYFCLFDHQSETQTYLVYAHMTETEFDLFAWKLTESIIWKYNRPVVAASLQIK